MCDVTHTHTVSVTTCCWQQPAEALLTPPAPPLLRALASTVLSKHAALYKCWQERPWVAEWRHCSCWFNFRFSLSDLIKPNHQVFIKDFLRRNSPTHTEQLLRATVEGNCCQQQTSTCVLMWRPHRKAEEVLEHSVVWSDVTWFLYVRPNQWTHLKVLFYDVSTFTQTLHDGFVPHDVLLTQMLPPLPGLQNQAVHRVKVSQEISHALLETERTLR